MSLVKHTGTGHPGRNPTGSNNNKMARGSFDNKTASRLYAEFEILAGCNVNCVEGRENRQFPYECQ